MPRRTRRRLVGRLEQYEITMQIESLAILEAELHDEWEAARESDGDADWSDTLTIPQRPSS